MNASARGFTLFDTPIGRCGIAWGDARRRGRAAPGGERGEDARRMRRASPARARRAAARRAGARSSPSGAPARRGGRSLDDRARHGRRAAVPSPRLRGGARDPAGTTLSYGEIATRIGAPGSARAVGQALGRNPFPIVVPCHRVLAAGGKTGGFTRDGGVDTKLRMLALEGAARRVVPEPQLFDGDGGLAFDWRTPRSRICAASTRRSRASSTPTGAATALELKQTPSLFGALAEAIVYQQLTGKAAATIYGRVCALFPRAPHGPTRGADSRASPTSKLRGAGLSAREGAVAEGPRPSRAGRRDPDARRGARHGRRGDRRALTAVRGIGRWTAEMLLIFRLGRPDVLPVDDYGVRKGFALAFRKRELPTPQELASARRALGAVSDGRELVSLARARSSARQ